ncbi:MAG TPA: LysM domain-containing protein [Thermoanaerobaculia bacterium]|nr:LysM domain-containing protein [Thermoanaerobaculia bacterium]
MATSRFGPTSRYASIETATLTRADGSIVPYVKRRFIPPPEAFETVQEHRVFEGERPDVIAADVFGDAELYWRLCDANVVMRPDDLTAIPGKRIRVTLPAVLPGGRRA